MRWSFPLQFFVKAQNVSTSLAHFHEPTIIVHGGIGSNFNMYAPTKMESILEAVKIGYKSLEDGDSALDASEALMRHMEDSLDFNCGYGSMLNIHGEVEMDACIMHGPNLASGAVGAAQDIQHPISLARLVMEKTNHLLICGDGAKELAKQQGMEILLPGALITERSIEILKERPLGADIGEGGVIAMDSKGNLAAAVSSGGPVGRMRGRCGDACRLGCGVYVDNDLGAVMVSGNGEYVLKTVLAFSIIKSMKIGLSAMDSVVKHINRYESLSGMPAGCVCLSKSGDVVVHYTAPMMAWAYKKGNTFRHGFGRTSVPIPSRQASEI